MEEYKIPLEVLEKYEIKKVVHSNSFNFTRKSDSKTYWVAGSNVKDFIDAELMEKK